MLPASYIRTLHWTVPFFLLEQDRARYLEVVVIFFPAKTNDFWRWGNGIRKEGLFVRMPSMRPRVVAAALEERGGVAAEGTGVGVVSDKFSSFTTGDGFPSSSPSLCVEAATPGTAAVSLSVGLPLLRSPLPPLPLWEAMAVPKEKFPGKINKNFPFSLAKFGTRHADRAI